jgi:hypothetical protein
MHLDFSISLTTVLAGIAAFVNAIATMGIWKIVRFVNLQKDFPPHRHINGNVLYPKDYAPEKAQAMGAGSTQ